MTTRRSKSGARQSGFTLVELLVAITVIAILVGMLSAAVIPALTRAKETAIISQMKLLEHGLEAFKNDHGFYPPSFVKINFDSSGTERPVADKKALLLRYLNKIAPNHREGVGAVGNRPIDGWWDAVGQYIDADHGDDLVFWLSGLSKNAQYPLTNNGTSAPVAYNDRTIERQEYFEFPTGQLDAHGVTAHFQQQRGVEASWTYIDSASYNNGTSFDGYHVLNSVATPTKVYENPNTYQLVCPGMDKEIGMPSVQWAEQTGPGYEGLINIIDRGNLKPGTRHSDNICNFCEGRLERLTNGVLDSSAVQY
ncbi:MAG: prepilin-type N-terminal cleavage/methylation domain-containing protein [Mariniblastus sp.]|nr:prepilin-type N-terminal cleavage/methylation domain-containing protein [Mariniblastus sp.]